MLALRFLRSRRGAMGFRRGDRIQGRRTYGGVLVVPCQLNDAYRYWFLADTDTAGKSIIHWSAMLNIVVQSTYSIQRFNEIMERVVNALDIKIQIP